MYVYGDISGFSIECAPRRLNGRKTFKCRSCVCGNWNVNWLCKFFFFFKYIIKLVLKVLGINTGIKHPHRFLHCDDMFFANAKNSFKFTKPCLSICNIKPKSTVTIIRYLGNYFSCRITDSCKVALNFSRIVRGNKILQPSPHAVFVEDSHLLEFFVVIDYLFPCMRRSIPLTKRKLCTLLKSVRTIISLFARFSHLLCGIDNRVELIILLAAIAQSFLVTFKSISRLVSRICVPLKRVCSTIYFRSKLRERRV